MRLLPILLPGILAAAPAPEALQEFLTPSGLRVVLEERHARPLIRMELRVGWEDRELQGHACAGDLLGEVLERSGAGGLSRAALERTLADRGLKLTLGGGNHSLAWSLLADSQNQEDAFAFLAHVVFRPGLAEGIAATLKESKASVTPEAAFRGALGFPGEGVTICDLDTSALYALHRRLVRPDHAILLIQGDLSMAQARQLVQLHLGTWAPAPEPPLSGRALPPLVPVKRRVAAGGQKIAWAGSVAPEGDARARAPQVLLALLLERAFRGAGDGIALEAPRPQDDAGPILFRTLPGVENPEQFLREHLERLASQGFSAVDLERARTRWRGERAALVLHPESQLAARGCGFLFGDPGAFLEDVRLEDVNAALRARLSTLLWLIQGPGES